MVLIVLCFGVKFLCCLSLMYVFIFLVQFRVTESPPFWGIAAHSAYDMFSLYKYLVSVILVFSQPSVYGVGISL